MTKIKRIHIPKKSTQPKYRRRYKIEKQMRNNIKNSFKDESSKHRIKKESTKDERIFFLCRSFP